MELWFYCFSHICRVAELFRRPSYAVLIDSKRWQYMSFHVPFSLSPPQSGVSDPSLRHIWVKLRFVNSNSISLSVSRVYHWFSTCLLKKTCLVHYWSPGNSYCFSLFFSFPENAATDLTDDTVKFQWNISKTRLNIWCGQWILSPGLPILFTLHFPHASVMISASSDLCLNYHHM